MIYEKDGLGSLIFKSRSFNSQLSLGWTWVRVQYLKIVLNFIKYFYKLSYNQLKSNFRSNIQYIRSKIKFLSSFRCLSS